MDISKLPRRMVALAVLAAGFCVAGIATAQGDWRKQYPKFRYGVQAVETQAAALTRYKGFGEYVKKKLGMELELFLSAEYAGVIQAIGAKQLEVMDMGAAGYAAAWLETKGGVEPLVVPTNNDGPIGYYAVAFVRSDSPYKSLNDLKGKTWAWVEPNSSSGYIFPLVGFRKMGLEPEKHFGKVVFSGGHEQSIIGVMDKAYDGAITWRRALAMSRNLGTIHVGEAVGFDQVAEVWRRVGVGTPPKAVPAITLGVFELTPLEVAQAYTLFVNGGRVRPLRAIQRIETAREELRPRVVTPRVVARADTTFLVTNMMRSVLNEGTAASARSAGFTLDAAGKTGTTNDLRDAWFVGFTPELLTVVWVGFDDGKSLGNREAGGRTAVAGEAEGMAHHHLGGLVLSDQGGHGPEVLGRPPHRDGPGRKGDRAVGVGDRHPDRLRRFRCTGHQAFRRRRTRRDSKH